MTKELDQLLFDKFKFFKPERPMSEALMCFGFNVGDGWFSLLWNLCNKIDKIEKPENFEVVQVKEKFGGLRFYTNYTNEEISKLIRKAEEISYKICDRCGAPGKVQGVGWIVTLCDDCFKEREKERSGK